MSVRRRMTPYAHPVALVPDPSGDGYVTPDGRWRARHDPDTSCAPRAWWWVSDATGKWKGEVAVPTLDHVKRVIGTVQDEEVRTSR